MRYAGNYSADIIQRVEPSFSPPAVRELIRGRKVFVAGIAGRVVGTASLDGGVVRTVFVDPDAQRQGVGRRLMDEVERFARETGLKVLTVLSSITAEALYARLGFKAVRDSYHGEERTIIMEHARP